MRDKRKVDSPIREHRNNLESSFVDSYFDTASKGFFFVGFLVIAFFTSPFWFIGWLLEKED